MTNRQIAKSPAGLRFVMATIIVSVFVSGGQAAAQDLKTPEARQGYYLSLGVRGILSGNMDLDGDSKWYGPWPGAGGEIRIGEAVNDWLDLGLNLGASFGRDQSYLATIGHFALDAQFRLTDPLFIRATVGFGFIDITRQKKRISKINGSIGASYQVAVGYDFFPAYKKGSGGFAVTPVIGMEALTSELIISLVGFVGIEMTWWTGLGKDKLDLSDDEAF